MSSELKKASVGPAFIGGICVFLVFGLLVLIWLHIGGKTEDFDEKRADARAVKLDLLQKENHEKLTSYAWVNKAKGIVQLPIDRAMELVVTDLKAKPVKASSVKLEVPYPAGLQQAPAAAAPATPAAPGAPVASPAPAASPAAPSPAPGGGATPTPVPVPAPPAATATATATTAPAATAAPAAASPAPAAASPTPAAAPAVPSPVQPAPTATSTPTP